MIECDRSVLENQSKQSIHYAEELQNSRINVVEIIIFLSFIVQNVFSDARKGGTEKG